MCRPLHWALGYRDQWDAAIIMYLSPYYVEIPSHFILGVLGGGYVINRSSQTRWLTLIGVGAGGTLWGVSSAHHTTLFSQTSPSTYRGADLAAMSALGDPLAQTDWTGPGQNLGSCRVSHPLPREEPAFKHGSLDRGRMWPMQREKQLQDNPGCGGLSGFTISLLPKLALGAILTAEHGGANPRPPSRGGGVDGGRGESGGLGYEEQLLSVAHLKP